MKNLICSVGLILSLLFIAILMQSCSSETGITSPNGSKVTPMTKTTVIPIVHINHRTDTVITLPNSKITIEISKSVPINKIISLDNYLLDQEKFSKSTISTPQSVHPNYRYCPYDTIILWLFENQYQSISGKQLGIWDDYRTYNWSNYYNNWGFNEIYLGGPSEYPSANNDPFKNDSIIGGLTPAVYQSQVQSYYSYGVKRFAFDEPLDSYNNPRITVYSLVNYTNWIYNNYPGSTVAFTTYEPYSNPFFSWYQSAIQQTYNSYIMCDQYQTGQEYMWANYPTSLYFGPTRANVGGNWVDYYYDYQENLYGNLFTNANNLGMRQIWFFADGTDDPTSGLTNFASYAWQNFWLLRYQVQKVFIMENIDGTCDPNGQWTCIQTYYTGLYYWTYY